MSAQTDIASNLYPSFLYFKQMLLRFSFRDYPRTHGITKVYTEEEETFEPEPNYQMKVNV